MAVLSTPGIWAIHSGPWSLGQVSGKAQPRPWQVESGAQVPPEQVEPGPSVCLEAMKPSPSTPTPGTLGGQAAKDASWSGGVTFL